MLQNSFLYGRTEHCTAQVHPLLDVLVGGLYRAPPRPGPAMVLNAGQLPASHWHAQLPLRMVAVRAMALDAPTYVHGTAQCEKPAARALPGQLGIACRCVEGLEGRGSAAEQLPLRLAAGTWSVQPVGVPVMASAGGHVATVARGTWLLAMLSFEASRTVSRTMLIDILLNADNDDTFWQHSELNPGAFARPVQTLARHEAVTCKSEVLLWHRAECRA